MATQLVSQLGNILNTTLQASTYTKASSFNSALTANALPSDLYAGHDWNSLSTPEQWWARWYTFVGNPVLATGIMSFLLHEVFYFGRCIPWIIVEKIPSLRKYKLQEGKVTSPAEQWRCTKYVLLTHFTVELPQIWGFHPMAEYFGMATHHVPFPSWTTIISQVILFFIIEDFWHYWAHRALHTRLLYKRIHKLHHEFSAPFGLAAEYCHPLEILILAQGTVGGPLLWCWWSKGNLHIITMYAWIILRLCQAVDAHSGYDFPWSFQHIFPLWSGADHHDHHHQYFIGNYATSFRVWDYVFGTDKTYRMHRQKAADEKKQAKDAARLKALGFKVQ